MINFLSANLGKSLLLAIFISFTGSSTAQTNETAEQIYNLKLLTQISIEGSSPAISRLKVIPDKKGQFLSIADDQSILFSAKNESHSTFNVKEQIGHQAKLTAFTLHPNFSTRDQPGFETIYIAYIEPFNTERKYARLQDKEIAANALKYDVVISEWQLNHIDRKVDISTKREVLRIGVPSKETVIKQLDFSPYAKSWNDDFGFLFVALQASSHFKEYPLYSGSLLRINPTKFGLRNYTIPTNNPFLNNDSISNESIAIGLQEIKQFIWPSKNGNDILLSHLYDSEQLLTLVKQKDDFRRNAPDRIIWRSKIGLSSSAITNYRGRVLPHLWGKIVYLQNNEQSWQLFSQTMPANSLPIENPVLEWIVPHQQSSDSKLSLFKNNSESLFLFNAQTNSVSEIVSPLSVEDQHNSKKETAPDIEEIANKQSMQWIFLIITFCFIVWVFWFNKKKRLSAKFIVRQQYSHLEISESKQQIGLYRRHQTSAETVLSISDIIKSDVVLNDELISSIDNQNLFSNVLEKTIREKFSKEKRDKMISNKVRRININLINSENRHFPICVYLRKGDNRVTRKKYTDVIEDIIDWCWLLSEACNSEDTEKRKPKPVIPARSSTKIVKEIKTTHAQQPTNDTENFKEAPKSDNEVTTDSEIDKVKENVAVEAMKSTNNDSNSNQQIQLDTEIITALDKLVKLKQQGYLSDEEFNLAKTKLLKDLTG